jgi:hypothetical protein
MATSIHKETGTGVPQVYDVLFPYLAIEHVFVYATDADYNTELDYEWVSDTQIEVLNALVGQEFFIQRKTSRDVLYVQWEDGAVLHDRNLQDAHHQHLYIAQEMDDGFIWGFEHPLDLPNSQLERSIKVPELEPEIEAVLTPDVLNRAERIFTWDAQGNINALNHAEFLDLVGVLIPIAGQGMTQTLVQGNLVILDVGAGAGLGSNANEMFLDNRQDNLAYVRKNLEWIRTSWLDLADKPTEFPPTEHTHDQYITDAPDNQLYLRTLNGWSLYTPGGGMPYRAVSISTAMVDEVGYVCDSGGGVMTMTLPVGGESSHAEIIDVSGSAETYPITIVASGGATIMGQPNFVLNKRFQGVELVKIGLDWKFIGTMGEQTLYELQQQGGGGELMQYRIQTTSVVTENNIGYICATSGQAITLILHDGEENDRLQVTDGDGNAVNNPVTIVPQAGHTIMGATSFLLNAAYQAVGLVKLGNDWKFINTVGEQVSQTQASTALASYTSELKTQLAIQGITLNVNALVAAFTDNL